MATRREKALQAAEKLVKKGRLEAAIEEFRKVLRESPEDTRTLNRVGDLYARLNRVDEAVELFSQAAERFSSEGFFVKAIAIYKKILRLDPTRMPVYQSLAELYQQQGLGTEARAQYQVVADYYEKAGDTAAVLSAYERLAELDPSDLETGVQLADLLAQEKRSEDALAQYGSIAAAHFDAGAQDEALNVLSRAVELVPESLQFVMQTVVELQARELPKVVERFLTVAEEHNPEATQARGLLEQVVPEAPAPEAVAEEVVAEPMAEVEAQVDELIVEQEPAAEAPEPAATEPVAPPESPPAAEPAPVDEDDTVVIEQPLAAQPVAEKPPAVEPEEPAPLETDEFEIELDTFEETLVPDDEPTAEAPAAETPAGEEVPEFELELVDETEISASEEAEEPEHEESVADILGEADALASYGLDEKAIDRLERAIELEPGHLGAYRRLIGIQLNARRDERVVRLAAAAASAALESGNTSVWRQIVGDLEGRGFRIEGSKIVPPPPPPPPVEETPAELLVDEPAVVAEPEPEQEVEVELETETEVVVAPVDVASETAVETVEREAEEPEEAPLPEPAVAAAGADSLGADGGDFFDLGAELELELGDEDELLDGGGQLESQSIEEIVEGFKQGMAEVLSPEAYDTHYNLGIAYREMGLVDEAIGEFQLAAKDPRYLVECCSLLGRCFQEKDFSDLALKWYRKGLESPAITEEETLGLLYEMGNLHLGEGDREAALGIFTEIYGSNSNFRDVVAKLEELRSSS
jgi:tetratricopeptide (TPR) repeat protein